MVDRRHRPAEYFNCPHCGAEVRVGSAACRECGSDAETGWSDDAELWQPDIPTASGADDDDFDYDQFIAREFPDQAGVATGGSLRRWLTGLLVAAIILSFLWWSLSQ